jgi:hypothetical protein
MPDSDYFVFNEPGMNSTFESWTGPTGKFIAEKSLELEGKARISAGFQTGNLIRSITTEYGRTTGGDLESHVGANPGGHTVGYALYHHEGTKPHIIEPNSAKALRFVVGGIVVYAQRVFHPGTRPVHYLTRWLRDVI